MCALFHPKLATPQKLEEELDGVLSIRLLPSQNQINLNQNVDAAGAEVCLRGSRDNDHVDAAFLVRGVTGKSCLSQTLQDRRLAPR